MHINKQRPLSCAVKGCTSTKQGAAETSTHKGRGDRQTDHKTVDKPSHMHTHQLDVQQAKPACRTAGVAATAVAPATCLHRRWFALACWSLRHTERDATPNSTMTPQTR